ncbi:PilW family protein [Marinobacter sp. HN1S83]|uniref:PilW family protein n=1 Tax=Marinobacter sp. HN1S83 TaxID=3382301 RepID=UPI00387B8204
MNRGQLPRVKMINNQYPVGRSQAGLSLVELMVALALSTTLILGIFTVYFDSSQTSRVSSALARIQESGRIAIDIMARDMRMVGYQGCADPNNITMNIIAENPPTGDFFSTTLRGWEVENSNWASGTEFDDTTIEADAIVGSDVIAIQRGETVNVQLTGNMDNTNANIQVGGPEVSTFDQNDIVLLSDCENADLFRISSNPDSETWAHAKGVNTDNRLGQAYSDSASVMRFSSTVYYVADTGRTDSRGNPIRALYRGTNNLINDSSPDFQVEELVEGVESLQIEYGEQIGTNSFRYRPADDVGQMTRVVALRMGLLISDAEPVRDTVDTGTYALPSETITSTSGGGTVTHPEDQRLRRVFSNTVALRNRD